jgi:hypothetical protein
MTAYPALANLFDALDGATITFRRRVSYVLEVDGHEVDLTAFIDRGELTEIAATLGQQVGRQELIPLLQHLGRTLT